jgi:tetratricopeptide (TPR) repeat protein
MLQRFPGHAEARIRLAHVLKLVGAFAEAAEVLQGLEAEYPDDPAVQKEFGRLAFARNRLEEAHIRFCAVLRHDSDDADAHHWLATIAHVRGDEATAQAHFRRTVAVKPVLRVPATKTPPDFSAMFLFAPGDANTPPDALVRQAGYDCGFLMLLQDAHYDVEELRRSAQVVVNLVSDADQGAAILPVAEALVSDLGLPVINHPHGIR